MLVGFSSTIITPTLSLSLDGYMDRTSSSTGILFDLYSKACVIQHDLESCVMVSLDVLGVDQNVVSAVKKSIKNQYNIDPKSIFINASHTHAAPQAARFGDMGDFFIKDNPTEDDLKYYDYLKKQIIKSIQNAFNNMQTCTIRFIQQAIDGVSSNRVTKNGYYNNVASLFYFENSNQELVGLWTIYANHPTVLDASNTAFSNDFISYYHQAIKDVYPTCTSMYLQGCAGDISSRYTKKAATTYEAKRLGTLLASQITVSLKNAKQLNETITTTQQEVVFETKHFSPSINYEQEIKQAFNRYVSLKEKNMEQSMIRSAYVSYQGKQMQHIVKQKLNVSTIVGVVGKIELGNVTILTTPAETFSVIDYEIQQLNKDKPTIVLGYTNGYVGYLVDDSQIDQEDVYERNMMVMHRNSHQKLIESIKKLIKV